MLSGKKKKLQVCMIPFMWNIPEENYRDSSCLQLAVGKEISCKQAQLNFWGDGNALKLDCGDDWTL